MTAIETHTDAGTRVDFRVLGPLEAYRSDEPCDLGGPKQRTVLAVLLAGAGRRVSTGELVDAVYGHDPPGGARRSVQTYVSNLRSALGDVVVGTRNGYVAQIERSDLDATRFEDAVAAAHGMVGQDPGAAAERLVAALALWRGHPYADLDGGPAIASEITRLEELRLVALEVRIDAELALGHHELLIPELDALTAEFPYRERLRAQHMLALYRSGRQTDALRAYQTTRTALSEELGIDPSPDLRALEQQILEHDESLSYRPPASVGRRTVLAADVDAEELAMAGPSGERVDRLVATDASIRAAIVDNGGEVFAQRLNATFASFGDLDAALEAVAALMHGAPRIGDGHQRPLVRVAIDVGDVVAGDEGVLAGPVVTRVAGLVGMAHAGQVLVSRDAHSDAADGHGRVFKSLGVHPIPRLDRDENVFQLLVDGTPADFPPLRRDRSTAIPGGMRNMPGYELREHVARGAAWSVWRAYQPSVGREVAIKVISPELASTPEFVRRFELEALTVARLEHPHIVPLFDYWRDLSGAYLVSRWITGGSLAARLTDRPLTIAEASRLIAEVGSALEAAHRSGVAHGRVNATSILVDADGAFYLHDFGVGVGASGTSGGELVVQDVKDLLDTVVDAMGIGGEAQQVIDRLRTRASTPVTIADLTAAWRMASGAGRSDEVGFTPARNPYRGLAAFSYADAEDFFGRDAVIRQILDALKGQRLVAVVGPSGVGKSSVVHAGVMPAVVEGHLPGSDGWLIAQLTPGAHPFEAFVSGLLRIATSSPPHLDEDVVDGDRGMLRAASRAFVEDTEILVIVDQFEELFTLTVDEDVRQHFLRSLATLVTDPASNARVIVTVRADFFDQPLLHPEFGELLRRATVPVSAPTEDELRDIIERPAAAVSVGFEAGLADRIVADVGEEPGRLPLLEYALTELFDRRSSDVLAFHEYEAIGGVFGALGGRAEETFATLDAPQASAARQVFLRLVTLTDAERVSRRRVRRADLERLDAGPGVGGSVVDAFVENRLLTLDRDPLTRGPTVEVAHEAIFSEWPRLAGWIDERRDDLAARRRLVEATQEWEDAGRNPAMLLGGGRLGHLEEWARSTDLSLTSDEAEFVEKSVERRDVAATAVRRRRRWIIAALASAALTAILLATAALAQSRNAERERRLAFARELSAQAVQQLEIDPERSMLLALEALDLSRAEGVELPETISALRRAIAAHRTVARYSGMRLLDVSPDGSRVATDAGGSQIAIIDLSTRELVAELDRTDAIQVVAVQFAPDGRHLAAMYAQEGTSPVWVWDLDTKSHVEYAGGSTELMAANALRITFNDTGDRLAAALVADARVWDVESRTVLFKTAAYSGDVRLMPGSEHLLVGDRSTSTFHLIDVMTGEAVHSFDASFPPRAFETSPDGSKVAYTSVAEDRVAVADVATGVELWRAKADRAIALAWLDDGSGIVVVGDRPPVVLDAATGALAARVPGHNGAVVAVSAIPRTSLTVTAGLIDGTIRVWDARPGPMGEVRRQDTGVANVRLFGYTSAPDRLFLSTAGPPQDAWIADGATLARLVDLVDPSVDYAFESRLVGEGTLAIGGTSDGSAVLVDPADGSVLYQAPPGMEITDVARTGGLAVIAPAEWPYEGAGAVIDVQSGEIRREIDFDRLSMDFADRLSFDGTVLYDGGERIYDTATGEVISYSLDYTSMVGLPDSDKVAIATKDGRLSLVHIEELRKGEALGEAAVWSINASDATIFIYLLKVSPDGSMLLTSPRNEPVRIWDALDGRLITELYPEVQDGFPASDFDPGDPNHVTVAADDGILLTYTLDVDELVAIATSRLTRSLTDEECVAFLHLPTGCPTG